MFTSSLWSIPNVRILGRHSSTQPVKLRHTASGLECVFSGSELWFTIIAEFDRFEPWISIELNGAWITRMPLARGENHVCVFRGMTPGVPKRIRLLKDVQAMSDDPAHAITLVSAQYSDGAFLPLPQPLYRLEFVGDSITSGEGTIGAVQEEDWIPAFFSAMNHYARYTADALNAEYRIFSQSGWGILSGWDNDPTHRVLPHYKEVCGLARGARNATLGAGQPNDFAAWPADAVIVNLGTNDAGASHNPPWTDPVTGETYAQNTTPEHRARLEQAVVDGLLMLRACNPQALLVWCYGMLGDELRPTLEQAVARYRRETGDDRAYFLPLPDTTSATVGARQHPGAESHRQAAAVLTEFLRNALR